MHLLVSVRSAAEASAALAGGADVIDAKDPTAGALGAVSTDVLREIHAASAGRRPVTAALGDAADESTIERAAWTYASSGARFVKVGFGGIVERARAEALAAAAVRGATAGGDGRCGMVAVSYADANRRWGLPPAALTDAAARAGAAGLLVDTADKNGPGLLRLIARDVLAGWVAEAHAGGLFVALAGRLTPDDLPVVRDVGADIAGVRGAACEGGRAGWIARERVRRLKELVNCVSLSAEHSEDAESPEP